ncbi:hypothetical protein HG15A2_35120 [Adhaeretor mobilis]|uniref:DUF420 domain-containing protein n=2 Tax=Adhaeretor mobilis TaxID=1930276 RepID=A0A517MZ75_9BACT|nr:hypothetical protein HG15A2_35120 [Adhaeretor mobilis]
MVHLLAAHPLVHLNAGLNVLATILLLVGYFHIRQGRVETHARTMLAALAVSTAFLVSYLTYHYLVGHVQFGQEGAVKTVYQTILATHIVLAAVVLPPMAIVTSLRGLKSLGWWLGKNLSDAQRQEIRRKHRQLACWTLPIWLYVSVTGVIIYVMLYHVWPDTA